MAENYTLVAGMDFARELGDKLAESSDAVLAKTRQLVAEEFQGLRQSVGEIVRSEVNAALQRMSVPRKPEQRPQQRMLHDYVPPQMRTGYLIQGADAAARSPKSTGSFNSSGLSGPSGPISISKGKKVINKEE